MQTLFASLNLYKGGIPAQYGSRLSSVFDVTVKNGNKNKISGKGGISPITGRLALEGPLFNKKGSFVIAGRSTYSDWILKKIDKPAIKNSNASFYDLNAKITYDLNERNSISRSFYLSSDYFKLNSDTFFNYNNINASISWKRTFTNKLYVIYSGIYSNYKYDIGSNSNPFNGFDLSYNIDYKELKADFSYFPNMNHTISFGASVINTNKLIKPWGGPEYRISMRYKTGVYSSLKFTYNRSLQYLHMMSNSMAISPTDIWKMSNTYLPPQKGNQVALGFYRNFNKNLFETSVEVYYKTIRDLIEYKAGTEFLLNEHLETDIINGNGKAYGIEFLIRKKYGKLNGWLSYTYASTKIKVDGKYLEEKINHGEEFPADYDKPHDVTLVSNYKFSRRISVSSNVTYSTGKPITMPVAKYWYKGRELVHYSARNEYRVPDYFRWDFSVNLEGNLKINKLAHSSLSLSVFNVTGRDNVYSIFFISDEENQIQAYKLSIFAQPVFTVAYNFEF